MHNSTGATGLRVAAEPAVIARVAFRKLIILDAAAEQVEIVDDH